MSDGYLSELAGNGKLRPLFLVFANEGTTGDGWRVCETDLEGDPVRTHSTHADLAAACNEANYQNAVATGKPAIVIMFEKKAPPLSFPEMLCDQVLRSFQRKARQGGR
jgi:hypothetical protein